jgi:hypothetical protein
MDAWVTPLGVRLRELPWLVWAVTRATLALEYVGPFLLFAPAWWLRSLTVLAFWALHLGIAASYTLGIFPFVDLVVLLPFLPPRVWDAVEAALARLGRVAGPPRRADPTAGPAPAAGPPWRARARAGAVAALLAAVLAQNLASVGALRLPAWLASAGHWLRIDQQWRMFTPSAPRYDGWWVIPGTLADGRIIDLSPHGPELTWEKPARISANNRPFRWAVYLWQMSDPKTNHALRRRWSAWTCRTWNATHPPRERLVKLEMHFVSEETLPPGEGVRVEPHFLQAFTCPAANELAPGDRSRSRARSPASP